MDVWWLALDRKWTSYQELRMRQVVAQGWRQLGDLRTLCRLATRPENEELFKRVIDKLAALAYGRQRDKPHRPGAVMWNLLRAQPEDLYVAIEGTEVMGVGKLLGGGAFTYRFDHHFEYGQTIGYPMRWIDWRPQDMGPPPIAPAQSVPGVAQIRNECDLVVRAFQMGSE